MDQTKTTHMSPAIPHRIDDLRAALVSVLELCPLALCDAEVCPLHAFRLLNRAERIQKFDSLEQEDLIQMAAFHHSYLGFKLSLD